MVTLTTEIYFINNIKSTEEVITGSLIDITDKLEKIVSFFLLGCFKKSIYTYTLLQYSSNLFKKIFVNKTIYEKADIITHSITDNLLTINKKTTSINPSQFPNINKYNTISKYLVTEYEVNHSIHIILQKELQHTYIYIKYDTEIVNQPYLSKIILQIQDILNK